VGRNREPLEIPGLPRLRCLEQAASRKLDKAASKGVIHKNQAANRKSSLAQQVSSL
jgi:small subunit ribosomal protein S20